MGVHLLCDQCGLPGGEDRGVMHALGYVISRERSLHVEFDYAVLLHWGCITDYVRRRDNEDQEPPF